MPNDASRREARRDYKESTPAAGIFALHGPKDIWIGFSRDLRAMENRILFMLGMGSSMNKTMQAAFKAAGGKGFRFERLEERPEEMMPFEAEEWEKARITYWREKLGAQKA
ncbi:MAG: GIY-YIG nuclease family protein [Paracoccaceae bacterium]